jgi:hypothetical protein
MYIFCNVVRTTGYSHHITVDDLISFEVDHELGGKAVEVKKATPRKDTPRLRPFDKGDYRKNMLRLSACTHTIHSFILRSFLPSCIHV